MLTISKVFTILFPLCLWEQGIPWKLSKNITKLFFQMFAEGYSLLGHTDGDRPFLGGGKHRFIYPLNYLLHMSALLTISKVFTILFLLFL